MRICALFPGQGFQRFGMLAGLAERAPRAVEPFLEQCDRSLPSLELSRLLLGQGEPVDTTPTEIAQPLLLAQGVAHFRAWQSENNAKAQFGMGHSLGEFTALVAAGILDFSAGLKLVRERGLAMRDAAGPNGFGMTMVAKPRAFKGDWLGLVEQCSAKTGTDLAAFNSPTQTVASGSTADLAAFVAELKQHAPKLIAKSLPVSSAFHSRHMRPAANRLAELVRANQFEFANREFDVVSNLTGRPYASEEEIRHNLVAALTSPVKWAQSYAYVEPQIDEFVSMGGEIGKLMQRDTKVPTSSF